MTKKKKKHWRAVPILYVAVNEMSNSLKFSLLKLTEGLTYCRETDGGFNNSGESLSRALGAAS